MLTEDRVPLDELSLPEDIASELSGDEPTPFTDDVPVIISDLEDVPVTELIVPTTGEIESIEVTTPNGTTITVGGLSLKCQIGKLLYFFLEECNNCFKDILFNNLIIEL